VEVLPLSSTLSRLFVPALLLLPLGGCFLPEVTSPPNVLLITLDSLTASHLGCYGYERETSPHIDAFAKQATLFRRAFATAPWTLPTHASIMTGKYPFEHGARTFKIREDAVREYPLDESFLTLAEALQQEGFSTAAITANTGYLAPRWKLTQGFDVYENERVNGILINKAAFKWLDAHGGEPFFLFLNYMDTHSPYETKKPNKRPDFLAHVSTRRAGPMFADLTTRLINGEEPRPEAELQLLRDLYDIGIANLDEYLQALFDGLRERGLYEDTMIVLTSDHGEYFGEHGLVEHGKDVYHNGLWIPLIIKYPNQNQGKILDKEVSSVDIPRLVFSRFPRDTARRYLPHFSGEPGDHLVISEQYYAHPTHWRPEWRHRFNRERTVVYDWPYKLIRSSDGDHELFDLESDPDETQNLIEQKPNVAARLRSQLERFKADRVEILEPGIKANAPTPEEIEELKALGYL
jgi:arylsulfatase A-like enzyme